MTDDHPLLLQIADDLGVGLEDVLAGVIGYLGGEAALVVDRHHQLDPGLVGDALIVLAEAGSDVDDAGAITGVDEVGAEYDKGIGVIGEVRHQRLVGAADKIRTRKAGRDHGVLAEFLGVATDGRLGQEQAGAVIVGGSDGYVVDVRADGERQIRRERPWRGRPGQYAERAGVVGQRLERKGHCQRWILAGAGGIVKPDLEVGQRRLSAPGVGHHAVGLVDEALVPKLFEGPDDGLHVGEIHRLVVVIEVDPAGLAGDVVLPFRRVAKHRRPTLIVEVVDAVLEDCSSTGHAGLFLGLHLGR